MNQDAIDRFWADSFFGCGLEQFRKPESFVRAHKFMAGYQGAFILKRNNQFAVSVPSEWADVFQSMLGQDLFSEEVLCRFLPADSYRYIGPSWIGYCTGKVAGEKQDAFVVNPKQAVAELKQFQEACDVLSWSHSGIDAGSQAIAVKIIDENIVSAADYHIWEEGVAHIGIVTSPAYRNQGYAKQVLSAITERVKGEGFLPQYRTLWENTAAIRTAEAVGYRFYASHISLRLQ